MNKNKLLAVSIAAVIIPFSIFAQECVNLLKNSEMKFTGAVLSDWSPFADCRLSSDSGHKSSGSARITLERKDQVETKELVACLGQWIDGLKPGKYIMSAYIKLDHKVKCIALERRIKVDDNHDFQTVKLTAPDQPEPGRWGKVVAEFNIPVGVTTSGFVFILSDDSPDASLWIDSPVLTYKAEQ